MDALLCFFGVSAGCEWTGDHLLPAVRDAPANRQTERLDFGRH